MNKCCKVVGRQLSVYQVRVSRQRELTFQRRRGRRTPGILEGHHRGRETKNRGTEGDGVRVVLWGRVVSRRAFSTI